MTRPARSEYPHDVLAIAYEVCQKIVEGRGFTSYLLFKAFKEHALPRETKAEVFNLVRDYLVGFYQYDYLLRQQDRINFTQMPDPLLELLRFGFYLIWAKGHSPEAVVSLVPEQGPEFFQKYSTFLTRTFTRFAGQAGRPLENLAGNFQKLPERKQIALRHGFPSWIVEIWAESYGDAFTGDLCRASNQLPPHDLRVNLAKATRERLQESLTSENISAEMGMAAPCALQVPSGTDIFKTRAFRRGWFEVQDQGSQLVTYLLDPEPGDVILDYCAGNGGKTLQLASLSSQLTPPPELHASDVSSKKLGALQRRLRKIYPKDTPIHIVPQDDLLARGENPKFTKILVDAPCSGLGSLRRNPAIKVTTREIDLAAIYAKQDQILDEAWQLLEPGGSLVYATCTINPHENENLVGNFLQHHPEGRLIPLEEGLGRENPILQTNISVRSHLDAHFFQLYPPTSLTDGFFGAILQKQKTTQNLLGLNGFFDRSTLFGMGRNTRKVPPHQGKIRLPRPR